jgi:hypothetical protein
VVTLVEATTFPLSIKVTMPAAVTGDTTAVKMIPPETGVALTVIVVLVRVALFTVWVRTLEVPPP